MKNTATIRGDLLLLALRYVQSLAKHTRTTGTGTPTLDEDGLRGDGFRPHPVALGVLYEGMNGGYPISLAWPQTFIWGGHPDEPQLLLETLTLFQTGLERTQIPIERALSRMRVVPLGEDAFRRFLFMLALGEEIRPTDLLAATVPASCSQLS